MDYARTLRNTDAAQAPSAAPSPGSAQATSSAQTTGSAQATGPAGSVEATAAGFLAGMAVLLGYQLLGECAVALLALPVSGPVAGMALLFLTLLARGKPGESIDRSASALLSHLALFFVPVGVGVVQYGERIHREWLPIAIALLAGTAVTLAATAWTMQRVRRSLSKEAKS